MAEGFLPPDGGFGGTRIGKIFLSNTPIDMESNGVTVFEGFYNDSIPVVVKRCPMDDLMLAYWVPEPIHPNIVRYWRYEIDKGFMYIAQERCTCSLYDLIRALSAPSDSSDLCFSPDDSPSVVLRKSKLRSIRDRMQNVSLWTDGGRPSPLLLKLMREVVSGLGHLHDRGLLHLDLRPQNISITGKPLVAKLSNIGSDLNDGAPGWQDGNPVWQERLDPYRPLPISAIDMFSFGCVLFFCVTGGEHPFGENPHFNIMNNNMDLSSVASIPEAHDLISSLLNQNPRLRPKASEVLQHPFLSISETRWFFFSGAKNRAVKTPHSTDAPKPVKEIGQFPAFLMEVVSRFCKKEVVSRKYLKYFK